MAKAKITEKAYQDAIIDLSAAKHLSLDKLIDETTPVSHLSLAFSSFFSRKRLTAELQGIEGLLNLLINQEGLASQTLKIDHYGQWRLNRDQIARLRTLYRAQRLQTILNTIRKDQQIIDDYAHQATVQRQKQAVYHPLKNPPVVRTEDMMSDLRDAMRSQSKKLERLAAKASLKESKEKSREILRRVSKHSRKVSTDDDQPSQPNW